MHITFVFELGSGWKSSMQKIIFNEPIITYLTLLLLLKEKHTPCRPYTHVDFVGLLLVAPDKLQLALVKIKCDVSWHFNACNIKLCNETNNEIINLTRAIVIINVSHLYVKVKVDFKLDYVIQSYFA
jgi:hypothetical protein